MLRLVILISAVMISSACAGRLIQRPPKLDGRIIGGYPVKIEDFPYQVSILYYDGHTCGGSIVTPRFVVTAGHCTDGASTIALSIIAGTANVDEGGIRIAVKEIHQHPEYDSFRIDYDISLLELASDLNFGDQINSVALPKLNQAIPVGADAVVSGWGLTSEGGSLPSQLQAVNVLTVSEEDCIAAYDPNRITARMTCAGVPEGGADACQGDSGGPLMSGGELIGIVSWGYGCGRPEYPGVYGNVPVLREFISLIAGV